MTKHEFVCRYCIAAMHKGYTEGVVAKALAKWDEIAKAVEPDPAPRQPNPFVDNLFAGPR